MKMSIRMPLWGLIALVAAGDLFALSPYHNHDLLHFDSVSADVREYVVHSITGCIRTTSIALTQMREDEGSRPEDKLMSESYAIGLDLSIRRCVEMLRGDCSAGGNKVCYLYETPWVVRRYLVLDAMYWPDELKPWEFTYYDAVARKTKVGVKKEMLWEIQPPYDPFQRCAMSEVVSLMFLTPEHEPIMRRLGPLESKLFAHSKRHRLLDQLRKVRHHNRMYDPEKLLSCTNVWELKPGELVKRLGVEAVFSNRVFRMNAGCAFMVDYDVPKLPRDTNTITTDLTGGPDRTPIMLLSPEEVSEVVRLAYAVDGDAGGFDAACARCPQLLRPVTEFRTGIGRMLREALSAGGMLPKDAPPAAKE